MVAFMMLSPCVLVAQAPLCLVSQVFGRALECQSTVVVFLGPRPIDRGDVQWHYWGSTEEGKCRSRFCWKQERCGCSCSYFIVYHNSLVFVKFIKNCIFHL